MVAPPLLLHRRQAGPLALRRRPLCHALLPAASSTKKDSGCGFLQIKV